MTDQAHAIMEPHKGIPVYTRRFAECLRIGAEKFGFSRRNLKPGMFRSAPISKSERNG